MQKGTSLILCKICTTILHVISMHSYCKWFKKNFCKALKETCQFRREAELANVIKFSV